MTDYCTLPYCGLNGAGRCPVCGEVKCASHLVRALHHTDRPLDFAMIDLSQSPEREQQAFDAGANAIPGWACVTCRHQAGANAILGLPQRPSLPESAPKIAALIVLGTQGMYTEAELRGAMEQLGGIQAVGRALYERLHPSHRKVSMRVNKSRVRGLLVRDQPSRSYEQTTAADPWYVSSSTITLWEPARRMVLTRDGRLFVAARDHGSRQWSGTLTSPLGLDTSRVWIQILHN
jgi:hypothetical protein